jgi:tetratricopeptide (TPR) repeat protein
MWWPFKPTDPKKQKESKFKELETSFANDPDMIAMMKAGWLSSRGNHSGKRGNLEAAIEDFEEAIRIKPDHLPSYFSLALAYGAKGMSDKAKQIIEAAPEETKLNGKVVGTKKELLNSFMTSTSGGN